MARYCGVIGFITTEEVTPGVYEEIPVERTYYGDLNRNYRRLQSTDTLNDNITTTNEISIVADPFAYENFHAIRYAEYMGTNWIVSNVDEQRPRLILSLGGVYNGRTSRTTGDS